MICKRIEYGMFNRDQLRTSLFRPTMNEKDSTNIQNENTSPVKHLFSFGI